MDNLVTVFNDLLIRHDALNSHDVKKDTISVREKMTFILDGLKNDEFIDFKNFIDSSEGRAGIIVIFLAILELIKMNLIECLQSKSMSVIYIKSKQQLENKEEVIYEQ